MRLTLRRSRSAVPDRQLPSNSEGDQQTADREGSIPVSPRMCSLLPIFTSACPSFVSSHALQEHFVIRRLPNWKDCSDIALLLGLFGPGRITWHARQCAILAEFALDIVGRFRQQSLPTYVVTFSPRSIITFYFLVGLVFIPIGAAILAGSSRVRGIDHVAYGKRPECAVANYSAGAVSSSTFTKSLSGVEYTCVVQFEVLQTIPAPSYLYYRLTSYFQNARDYARSLSDVQLRGVTPRKILDVETCVPLLYENRTAKGTHGFNASEFMNPCGAIAASRFNDTFRLFRDEALSSEVPLQKDGIAWRSDKAKKFRPGSAPVFSDKTNKLLLDEDFMVWMRLSAFSDFDKLYRIVKADISPGRYYMAITSSYPVESFRGDKMFFISTMTWFGSSNFALGGVFVVAGSMALLVGTVLLVRFLRRPRIPIVHDPDRMLRQLAKLKLEYGETYQPSHA